MRGWISTSLLLLAACASRPAPPAPPKLDPEPRGPAYLAEYKEVHYRALGDHFVAAWSDQQLFDAIGRARVLYLGDHHEDLELHAGFMRLLARLLGERQLCLAVEFLGREDEDDLHLYLAGHRTLAQLRQRHMLRIGDSWLESEQLDRAFYAELLRFARQHRIAMHALEPVPRLPLERRDRIIADRVRALAERDPDRLVVVVVGHAHLLGEDRVVPLAAMPSVVLGARMSRRLAADLQARWADSKGAWLVSSGGAIFPTARNAR